MQQQTIVLGTPQPSTELNLRMQNLESLEGYDLSTCTSLDVSINALSQLPPLPENITRLDCISNCLTNIPPSKTLQFLSCQNNRLTHFNFADFPSLDTLFIDESALLNSDLKKWPTGIIINFNTPKTLKSLLKMMKVRLEYEETFEKYQKLMKDLEQMPYMVGGEKYLEAEQTMAILGKMEKLDTDSEEN
jgi:Leucine-rich repeat (LRR) protein